MAAMIRHHTDAADARARRCAPNPKLATFDKAPSGEANLGLIMARLSRKEGHRGKTPVSYGTGEGSGNGLPAADVTSAMLDVMTHYMTPTEIAESVQAILGRPISPQLINDRLRKGLKDAVVFKARDKKTRVWRLK